MAIQPATRLGPYEVLSAIGAGGMGEVYKARDTRLDRIVAIKVLPQHLADKPEPRERFEREARTIAGLNHPHICTLYDVGHQDGTDFLVMEYLEGETLATRLLNGPLPLEQVLQYAIEISDALDKAHRKGVTHRDIKPGNVMLTKSGMKLLDFGLAKLKQAAAPPISVSQMPTMSQNPTVEGTLLGTLQYMAPEQVEGKVDEIDGRTDIFAFGALVYEMATGKKAFEGETNASVMSKIMQVDPPPISTLRPMTPPALNRVTKKCLAKEPEKRWQVASDLCDELKWISESHSQVTSLPTASATGVGVLGRRALIPSLGVLLLCVVIASIATWNLKPTPAPPLRLVSRYSITLPQGQQLAVLDNGPALTLSPDGTHLAYVATVGSTRQLYLRAMDSFEANPIPGTEGAAAPFFSPDGQWLGFFADGKLKKVSVGGGAALTLGDAPQPRGASWGSQGTIIFAPNTASVLQQVTDAGSAPQAFTQFDKGEVAHAWPEFLPGSKSVLFAGVNGGIAVQSVETGEHRKLVQPGTSPRYASSGHLVYAQGGTLMAQPFDAQRFEVAGKAVPVVENVLQSRNAGAAEYGISNTGSLVYVSGNVQSAQSGFVWVSRNGTEEALAAPPHDYSYSRLSPDGRQLAVTVREQGRINVWLYDISRQTLGRFTFEGNVNAAPTWAPDGKRIAFLSTKGGPQNMFWQLADGSGGLEQLTASEYSVVPMSWSSDGNLLAFIEINPRFSAGAPRMLFEGPYLTTQFTLPYYDVSADGQRFLMVKPTEQAQVAPTQINIVQNWFEELKRRVPTGTK